MKWWVPRTLAPTQLAAGGTLAAIAIVIIGTAAVTTPHASLQPSVLTPVSQQAEAAIGAAASAASSPTPQVKGASTTVGTVPSTVPSPKTTTTNSTPKLQPSGTSNQPSQPTTASIVPAPAAHHVTAVTFKVINNQTTILMSADGIPTGGYEVGWSASYPDCDTGWSEVCSESTNIYTQSTQVTLDLTQLFPNLVKLPHQHGNMLFNVYAYELPSPGKFLGSNEEGFSACGTADTLHICTPQEQIWPN